MLNHSKGKRLLEIAKNSVTSFLEGAEAPATEEDERELSMLSAVFVTITKNGLLRGCIGQIVAREQLHKAVYHAARSAAFEDPRFDPVTEEEVPELKFEVSVLTPFELIVVAKPDDYFKKIEIGKDGLYLEREEGTGLLLPQVAKEYHWSAEQFLIQLCYKAGLSKDDWKIKSTKIYKFQAQIFSEDDEFIS